MTDTDQAADQSQDQGNRGQTGAAAPAPEDRSTAFFQGAYTRAHGINVAIAKELGLPKDASQEEYLEALAARAATPVEPEDETPAEAKRRRDLDERSWRLAEQQHGEGFTQRARELYTSLARRKDPGDFVDILATALAEIAATSQAQGANPGQGQAQPAATSTGGEGFPDLGQPTGRPGAATTPPNPADYKGNPVGLARRLLGLD